VEDQNGNRNKRSKLAKIENRANSLVAHTRECARSMRKHSACSEAAHTVQAIFWSFSFSGWSLI